MRALHGHVPPPFELVGSKVWETFHKASSPGEESGSKARTPWLLAMGSLSVPAGAWHWHSATRSSSMCHIAIKRPGATNWKVEEKNWASGYDE